MPGDLTKPGTAREAVPIFGIVGILGNFGIPVI